MKDYLLTASEQHIMYALMHAGRNAYGMTIRQELLDRSGRDVSIGSVYTTLARLEKKGFVKSQPGEATAKRGGRAKRYFKITGAGQRALTESRAMTERMAYGLLPEVGR